MPKEGKWTNSRRLNGKIHPPNIFFFRGVCEVSFAISRIRLTFSPPPVVKIPFYELLIL